MKLAAFFLVLFWPTVMLNSAPGHCDSVYAALAVLSVSRAGRASRARRGEHRRHRSAFELQAVFVMPVFLLFWLTRRVKLRHTLVFPATCVVMVLPAVIAGRGLWDALTIPFQQTGSMAQGLVAQLLVRLCALYRRCATPRSPQSWHRRSRNRDRAAGRLVLAAPGQLLRPGARQGGGAARGRDPVFSCRICTTGISSPQMRSRSRWRPRGRSWQHLRCCPFLLLGYRAYLRMRYLLPMADGALALIAVLVILAAVLALELGGGSPLNEKNEKIDLSRKFRG